MKCGVLVSVIFIEAVLLIINATNPKIITSITGLTVS